MAHIKHSLNICEVSSPATTGHLLRRSPSYNFTLWKINMAPENGLEDDFPFQMGDL